MTDTLHINAPRRCDVPLTDAELETQIAQDQTLDKAGWVCWQCGQLISVCDAEGCKTAC